MDQLSKELKIQSSIRAQWFCPFDRPQGAEKSKSLVMLISLTD